MKKTIREKGILVSLKIRRWSAFKNDSDIAKQVENITGAKSGTGKYTKSLIDRNGLSEINSVYTAATKFHENKTMPWFSKMEILPATEISEYNSTMREFRQQFEKAVETITNNYSSYINQAQKDLGSMFKLHEYPTVYEIEKSFQFEIAFMPLPDYSDFRIDLNNSELAAIQQEMQQQQQTAIKTMETDLFNRLYKAVEKIVSKLSDTEKTVNKGIFDTLEELLDILPDMNITDNKNLIAAIKTAKTEIIKDPESIKSDTKLRETVNESAEKLLETISDYADCF